MATNTDESAPQEHVSSEDCWCGPDPVLVQRDDLPDGWLYVHHGPGTCTDMWHQVYGEAIATIRAGHANVLSLHPPRRPQAATT